jgi:hypothetical protein
MRNQNQLKIYSTCWVDLVFLNGDLAVGKLESLTTYLGKLLDYSEEYMGNIDSSIKRLMAKVEQDMYRIHSYQLVCFLVKLDKRFKPYLSIGGNSACMSGLSQQLSNSI